MEFVMTAFLTEHSYLLAQICGFVAMATAVSMYQFKRHRTIMILMVVCSFIWCMHYCFLGLFTPVMMNIVNVIRNIVYSFRDRKWAQSKLIPVVFVALSIALAVITWDNIWSVLPLIAAVFTTVANWQTDTKILKYMTIPVCICWFIFNFINHSYAGMANEILALASIIISLTRIKKQEKQTV